MAGYGDYGRDLLAYAHFTVPGKIRVYNWLLDVSEEAMKAV